MLDCQSITSATLKIIWRYKTNNSATIGKTAAYDRETLSCVKRCRTVKKSLKCYYHIGVVDVSTAHCVASQRHATTLNHTHASPYYRSLLLSRLRIDTGAIKRLPDHHSHSYSTNTSLSVALSLYLHESSQPRSRQNYRP